MRLDRLLVEKGLTSGRDRASELIRAGAVRADGRVMLKPSADVRTDASLEIASDLGRYVSRGALKLIDALDGWSIDVSGRICADVGASTGGFTQVLLERGADRVIAIDVGTGQLHPTLADDPRVTVLERTNIRSLTPDALRALAPDTQGRADFICCDVSFISLTLVLPVLSGLIGRGSSLVALIKPQFEVGRRYVGRGGIVRDDRARRGAVESVTAAARRAGFRCAATRPSPVTGGDGNIEFLAHFIREPFEEAL